MFLQNIFTEIEKTDPEIYERTDTRRSMLKSLRGFSGKLALTAVPIALGSLFKKAYAHESVSSIADILNFALTLEYLEAEFYKKGLEQSNLFPAEVRASIEKIYMHESEHVEFLKAAITSLGATPVKKPKFDFTGGQGSGMGPFANVFSNSRTFINVAQTFEDTGVRAYKGQAGALQSNGDILTAALNIHSTEARHAAHIRLISRLYGSGVGDIKPWITLNNSNINSSVVQPSYNGEENTTQAGVQIMNIGGFPIKAEQASESFDEPLTMEQVRAIAKPFIA